MVRGSSWEGRHGSNVSLFGVTATSCHLASTTWRSGESFWVSNLDESNASAPDWQVSPALHCLALLITSLRPQSALCYKGAWEVPFEFFFFFYFSAAEVQHSIVARLREGIL